MRKLLLGLAILFLAGAAEASSTAVKGGGGGASARVSANCAAETGGVTGETCYDTGTTSLYACEVGPCSDVNAWVLYSGAAAAGDITDVGNCAGPGACFGGGGAETTLSSATDLILDIDSDNNGDETFLVTGTAGTLLTVSEAGLLTVPQLFVSAAGARVDVSGGDPLISFNDTDGALNVAGAGVIRLENDQSICWRNNAAGGDVCITVGADDILAASSGAILANTATALAANGANCAAGNYPLGVDAAGAVENCTAVVAETNSLATLTTGIADNQVPMGTGADAVTYKTMPATGTNGCSGVSDALQYNTVTDSWTCLTGIGVGTGDITDVFSCVTGDCAAVTVEAGETLNATTTGTITATAVDATGAGPITIGSADVTAVTVTTDNTGDGSDLVLPAQSVNGSEILTNTITETQLAATITFANGDLLDFGTNVSSATEGLMVPANANNCASATAEGQVCWQEDTNHLWIGDGVAAVDVGPGTVAADAIGTSELDEDGDTAAVNELVRVNSATANTFEYGPVTMSDTGDLDAVNAADFDGAVTAPSFTADPSATPSLVLDDSDTAAESTDASITADATDTGAGTEDVDLTISTQTNSTLTSRIVIDADGPTSISNGGLVVTGTAAVLEVESATPYMNFDTTASDGTPASRIVGTQTSDDDGQISMQVETEGNPGVYTVALQTTSTAGVISGLQSGKIDRNNYAVDDDDCTGEQGLFWYDTTDSHFEFCDANSGAPFTVGVAAVADGTGIDGTAPAGGTYTPTLDLTEINSATFGSGTFTTLSFDAGATDPLFTFGSNSVAVTNAATFDFVNNSISTADLATERRAMYWGAGSWSTDGTNCSAPAEVTINSGPKLYTVICNTASNGIAYGSTVMPESWDGGTVTFTLTYIQTAADTSAMNSDIDVQCHGNGETVDSTFGTPIAIDDAGVTGSNKNDQTTSAAVTPAGTCAGGDVLYWRWTNDATGTTSAQATLHYVGLRMQYTSTVGETN